jgi:DNA-binding MarR family transcriptional regulator
LEFSRHVPARHRITTANITRRRCRTPDLFVDTSIVTTYILERMDRTPAKLGDEIKKRHPFDSPVQEAYLNVMRTHGVLTAEAEQVFKSFGLSAPKYNVLRILRGAKLNGEFEGDGLPCLEIGARMITRVPDVTRLVDRLEDERYVVRNRTAEDRRVVLVAITDKALKLLAEMDPPLRRLHESQAALMSAAEWAELSRLLVKARRRQAES